MRPDVIWLLVGIGLIVVEMMTGTFYLLILGIAAIVASIVAFLGGSFTLQVIVAGAVAIIATFYLQMRRKSNPEPANEILDAGQPVIFDSWISEPQRLARVKYRDALWDAQVAGSEAIAAGSVLYITGQHANGFTVSSHAKRN